MYLKEERKTTFTISVLLLLSAHHDSAYFSSSARQFIMKKKKILILNRWCLVENEYIRLLLFGELYVSVYQILAHIVKCLKVALVEGCQKDESHT